MTFTAIFADVIENECVKEEDHVESENLTKTAR